MTMSSTSDKKTNFFFANCMKCEGIIRIPITIRPDSSVSCPHCKSQFDLIAFLDQIPEADVTEGNSSSTQVNSDSDSGEFKIETGAEQVNGKFVVPAQLAAGMRKRRRRRRRSSSSESAATEGSVPSPVTSPSSKPDPNRQLSEAEELKIARRENRAEREREKLKQQREAAAARVNAGQRNRSSRPRRQEAKRSPMMEAFKIIVGGLMAAPIAYLLLMWVFSRDPLGLVPQINNYAPILVPPRLEPQEEGSLPSAQSSETSPGDILSDSDSDSDFDSEFEDEEFESEFDHDPKIP